ncbi:MAG TPA: hypothetical protein VHE61_08585 [Opitutaceae bacterium]|nr:hypothetical protein [Opitutaceae bacterium]
MKRFRRASAEQVYRSARTMVWINGVGAAAFLILVGVAELRGQEEQAASGLVFAGIWLGMTGVALWRMRRARKRSRTIELFSAGAPK